MIKECLMIGAMMFCPVEPKCHERPWIERESHWECDNAIPTKFVLKVTDNDDVEIEPPQERNICE